MESLVKCAKCGKKPRTLDASARGKWKGETTGVTTVAGPTSSLKTTGSTIVNAGPTADVQATAQFANNLRPEKGDAKPKDGGTKGHKSIFDKLTDTSLYTGAHRERFDAGGRGKGMAGRDAASGVEYGGGTVHDLKQIMRSDGPAAASRAPAAAPIARQPLPPPGAANTNTGGPVGASAAKPKSGKKKPGASIFDKLTDPNLYTGAHKLRFDSSGKGRGLAGRDAASGIEYGSGAVHDLRQIMRPNIK